MAKNKDITVNKTIWRKFLEDGTEVHEVTDVTEYRSKGIQVFVQEGKRKDTPTFYVSVENYTPRKRTAKSLAEKVSDLTNGADLSTMTGAELVALLS